MPADPDDAKISAADILATAVDTLGGVARPGQQEMAQAIEDSLHTGQHLLIQAGTGTGKSMGYLAPALAKLAAHPDQRIVIATATLALQNQLAKQDIPTALVATQKVTGRRPRAAVLKGRSNYACMLRLRDQVEDQDTLLGGAEVAEALRESGGAPNSVVGAEVLALREWAETEVEAKGLADRDDAPSHGAQAWAQVSIPVRECLGAQRCTYGDVCFVERSREKARAADLIVTNHALLAIDAMHGGTALPEHSALIVDEAHEVVSRVTGAASDELSPQLVERVARRTLTWLDDDQGEEFLTQGEVLTAALDLAEVGEVSDDGLREALAQLRDVTRGVVSALAKDAAQAPPEKRQAASAVKEVFDIAERMAAGSAYDVLWVIERERFGRELRIAPLTVAGLMRERILAETPTILTSATLRIGGDFLSAAGSLGLRADERTDDVTAEPEDERQLWRGIDVGSPFDYRQQGITYVASKLSPPGRDGISTDALAEIAELVWAAGGRTLGLFASQRSARLAAEYVRKELPKMTTLCQGDAQLSDLTKRFTKDAETSLFGTLSLWQGIDVPGDTCRLVIIDKIPFPRPDDPLMQARQRRVAEAGGNGFMSVAASHAALLMAQGSGRLIRRHSDRGVVAILDPRLITARYGGFLRAGMPPMWMTTDREVAVSALRRLDASGSSE